MESEDLEPRDSTEAEDQEISNQAEVKDRLSGGSVSENEDDLDLNRGQADDFDNLGDDPLSPGPETPPVTSPGNPGPASPEEPPPQDQDELHGEDISQPQQHDLDLSPRETAMSEGSSPESKMHVDDLDIRSETQKSMNNDGSGKEYPDSNYEGEYDGDEANTSNDYSRTEKQTESKHSDDGSGSESINSSLVSQRTLETTSENMDVAPTTGSHDDHYLEKDQESVGGSSKAEEDGHVVVGLEALDSLATENGRCGSPSIVSEATDTVAGSLVVETGSLGGESGTVRSMPQSETSDVDYQDVENGEEMTYSNYPSEAKEMNDTGETGEKSADESEEDMEVTQETVELGPKSPQDPETEENNENSELTSRNVDQSLVSSSTLDHTAAGNDKKHITTEDRGENEEKNTASYSRQDSLDSGEVSEAEDFKSQEPPPDDDFDYDDLDLEPVSENETSKPVEKESAGSVSEVADSSEVTEHDTSQESRVRHSSSKSDRDSHKRNRNRDAFHGIDSRQSKPRRSPKGSLSDDDVELDYDEEGLGEEKTRHVEIVDDDLENGELPDDDDEGEIEEKSDDGELEDDDDCEEGEIREPGSRKPFVKPICRFYLNSKCTWGNNCRFLHPGVNDKGNYRLIDRHDYNNKGRRGHFGGPGPGPWSQAERVPEPELPPPVPEPQPSESAWERGLRHAKELMKKASHRKETDPGFEEKRLNLSLEEEREFNKENDQRRLGGKDAFVEPSFEEELYEKPIGAWQPGQYENFEVRWQREPDFSPYRMQDKDRGFRDRRLSPPSPRMGHPAYMGNQPHTHPMQHDNRYNKRRLDDRRDKWREPAEEFNSGGPRVRADVWHDPWRRSKSPKRKPRDSPSRSRSRGRRRYRRSYSYSSSYSSSVFSDSRSRSRSSYSSLSSRSSLSRTSSFSSRSRSRSLDIERRRPPGDPLTSSGPTLGGRGGGPVGGAKGGVYMAGAGPQGDRKIPPNNKPGEPRSAVSIKQRHQRPGPDQRRPVIGPMPRPSVRDKPLPFSSEGRGRGMIDRLRDDRGRGRGRGGPKEEAGPGRPGRPPGKKRGASISSSGSSQSRSRSRSSSSTSRSQSVSSVSSVTSSSSSSSSGSADSEHLYRDIAEPEPGALDKDRAQGPAGRGRRKEGAEAGPGGQRPGPRADRDRGHRGSKDRPPREKRPRRSPPPGMPPGGRGMRLDGRPDARPDMRRGPMIGSGKPQVSSTTTAKSKDPMKSVGQKSNIKLTLISKPSDKNGVAGKKRPADGAAGAAPAAKRPPISPTKQPQDKAKQRVPAGDKPGSPKMRPPQAPLPAARPVVAAQGGRLPVSPIKPGAKPATPAAPTPASVTAAAAAAAKAAKKSTSSRREELLKQLKAVEDAIARKRSKLP